MDIVVSNRVARLTPDGPMVGGLASALLPAVQKAGVVWFGSSGKTRRIAPGVTPFVQIQSYGRGTIVTVDSPERHYAGFYDGFANSALWPLLHSRTDLLRCDAGDYRSYREVNGYMARSLAAFGGTSSAFWVHDYHFLPLGFELRKLGIRREIGFFLHTPWPRPEAAVRLPQYRELATAMLAYDLIGFQTDEDRNNFADLLRRELHIPEDDLVFRGQFGTCRLGTFPIGIDTQAFADSAQKAAADPQIQRLRASLGDKTLMIGVDRVDYSKGLLQRVQAFDRLLTRRPDIKRQLSMVQIAIPSRCQVSTYRELQRELATAVASVNGKHGEIDWTPIRYLNRGYCQSTLAGFYRAAKVGLVTPLQDGMNLVAKEYVAAQDPTDPGVLVLSRFAGAAHELSSALLVDPHDVESVSRRIETALAMPIEERRRRWQHMMDALLQRSIHSWFLDFLAQLKSCERKVFVAAEPAPALSLVGGRLPRVAGLTGLSEF